MTALQKNGSAAGRMAVVDRVLDGRRVIGFSVSCGAVFCCRVIGADVHVTDPHFFMLFYLGFDCCFPGLRLCIEIYYRTKELYSLHDNCKTKSVRVV